TMVHSKMLFILVVMKTDSVEKTIQMLVDASIEHGKASEDGDYKTGNKNYDIIVSAAKYLNENDSVNELLKLLNHENVSVQLWAATYLLEKYESEATQSLVSISKKNITHYSFDAKITLEEWKNGNLKLIY
ncbi:MAG: DUF2019 domain-containing protein, partial [Bacteroidota bacterium]